MIVCPNPDCAADMEAFEVYTLYGLTGSRLVVDCPDCDKTFEVDVIVRTVDAADCPKHQFIPEHLGISDAKRRLANCTECGHPRTADCHIDD